MDQFSSHENPRLEVRPPKVAAKPMVSQLRSGTARTRLRRAVGSPGRQSHEESRVQQLMDAAIQRDLQNQREGLTGRMAALLLEADGALLLDELAELLSDEPGSEAISGFLTELGEQELGPEELLQALADFAASNDAVPAVVPVVAAISMQSLSPFAPERSVDELADLMDSLSEASADLAEVHGPEAMAVMPRILSVIQHHARLNRLQPTELPAAIRRITHQVATSGPVVQRLMRQPPRHDPDPLPPKASIQGAAGASSHRLQRLVIDRPAEITIRYLD
jgi:hypothetical protein